MASKGFVLRPPRREYLSLPLWLLAVDLAATSYLYIPAMRDANESLLWLPGVWAASLVFLWLPFTCFAVAWTAWRRRYRCWRLEEGELRRLAKGLSKGRGKRGGKDSAVIELARVREVKITPRSLLRRDQTLTLVMDDGTERNLGPIANPEIARKALLQA